MKYKDMPLPDKVTAEPLSRTQTPHNSSLG